MIVRAWLEKWRQWQARRLRHGRTQALWRQARERAERILRTYRSLPRHGKECLRELPESLQRLLEGIYEHLLQQDRILRHLPPDRWFQRLRYTALAWWHEHRAEIELAITYRLTLKQLEEARRQRNRALLAARQIEAQIHQWLVALDVLHDRVLLLHSQPRVTTDPPEGLLEALQELQQEIGHYQQSLEEVEEWLENRRR
jgi:chromosome segregation ATPase